MSEPIHVKAINGGRPFTIDRDDITLGVMKAILRSESESKKTWASHEQGEFLAQIDTLLPAMVKVAASKDPSWHGRSASDLEDALSVQELMGFVEGFVAAIPSAAASAQGAAGPLVHRA